ncbi:hypothetical protein Efla_000256 [Eimeria flavescens]
METILSCIAEAPMSASAKKRAYELIIKIVRNIIQAVNNEDPNLEKYKWIKAQAGSSLRENVLNVSPLFRDLLEALGFTFRVGRPPHVRGGAPQEYVVLQGAFSVDDLASSLQVLEAVLHSICEEEPPPESPKPPAAASAAACGSVSTETEEAPASCPPSACSIRPRPSGSPFSNQSCPDSELEALRREQQERYRQRAEGGGGGPSRPSAEAAKDSSETDDSRSGGWFWQRLGWGGGGSNNSNDDSSSHGRSTSSRRPPLNNRMMTLRDLPKPQRRG